MRWTKREGGGDKYCVVARPQFKGHLCSEETKNKKGDNIKRLEKNGIKEERSKIIAKKTFQIVYISIISIEGGGSLRPFKSKE